MSADAHLTYAALSSRRSQAVGRWLPGALIAAAAWACSSDLPSRADDATEDDPATVLIVSRVEPRILTRGATFDLRIFGSGFDAASRVRLTTQGAPSNAIVTNSTGYVSSDELTANVTTAADAPAGPYQVVVTSGAGKQGVGTELVDLAPQIAGIAPSPAEVGQAVNISGSGFGLDRSSVRVTFDGREGSVLSARDGMVVAEVPVGVAMGTIRVELSVTGFSVPASFHLEVIDPIPQVTGIHISGVMGALFQGVRVSRAAGNVPDAVVTVNGVAIPHCCGDLYSGELPEALPAGSRLELEVSVGGVTVEATGKVLEAPVLTIPATGTVFASSDSITVTWTSAADPDRFEVCLNCWENSLYGSIFQTPGTARELKIAASDLVDWGDGAIVGVSAAIDDGVSFTGPADPGSRVSIVSSSPNAVITIRQ